MTSMLVSNGFRSSAHWADSTWTYRGKAFCGREMTETVRLYEGLPLGKRVCRACAKIMAKLVARDHAEALAMAGERDAAAPVLRLKDAQTGLVRHVLGTSLTKNAPHKTVVWVQREGEQGCMPWSADELMSTWHPLVAVDENGRTNAEHALGSATWHAHFIKGIAISGRERAEVLGSGTHEFSGQPGIWVRYEDLAESVFLNERVLRGCPDYVALPDLCRAGG
jgi:hypothetical protein